VNLVHRLAATADVALERFEHAAGVPHRDPERERARGHGIHLVVSGSFRLRLDAGWQLLTPDRLYVSVPGREFSCAHDEEYPIDRCLSVRFGEEAIESLRGAGARSEGAAVRALSNRRADLRRRLEGLGPGDAARLEAIAGALYWTLGAEPTPRPLYRERQLTWYATRVDRARELIECCYEEDLSLARLAREVGMSLFAFARVFAELVGETPHRYLVAVRLREAARRLRAGQPVTEVAHAVGYGSLGHFISSFRRAFGATPSRFARSREAEPAPERGVVRDRGRWAR
jgi:AraC-like DNA-binding protein